jgi:hypothetical protein
MISGGISMPALEADPMRIVRNMHIGCSPFG